jgi:hypothetical protein
VVEVTPAFGAGSWAASDVLSVIPGGETGAVEGISTACVGHRGFPSLNDFHADITVA